MRSALRADSSEENVCSRSQTLTSPQMPSSVNGRIRWSRPRSTIHSTRPSFSLMRSLRRRNFWYSMSFSTSSRRGSSISSSRSSSTGSSMRLLMYSSVAAIR